MRPIAASLCIGGAAFFLLAGYEFARSASSSLFIGKYGADSLPFVMALSPVGTLAFLYSYGILLSWLKPRATLAITTLLSGGGLLACYLLIVENIGWGTALLFILREGYIVVLIEQYWSFIDSTLSEKQAQRYNGPICGFASIGAIAGSTFVGFFAKHWRAWTLSCRGSRIYSNTILYDPRAYQGVRFGGVITGLYALPVILVNFQAGKGLE